MGGGPNGGRGHGTKQEAREEGTRKQRRNGGAKAADMPVTRPRPASVACCTPLALWWSFPTTWEKGECRSAEVPRPRRRLGRRRALWGRWVHPSAVRKRLGARDSPSRAAARSLGPGWRTPDIYLDEGGGGGRKERMRPAVEAAWESDPRPPGRGARRGHPVREALPLSGPGSKTCPRPSARPPCHSLSFQPMARPPVTLSPPLGAARGGRSAGAERAGPELND